MAQHCDFVKDGKQCRSFALKRDTKCFSHSERPETIERRAKARVKGGLNARRNGKAVFPDINPPTTIEEAERILARLTAALLNGNIDPQTASTASKLCDSFIRAHKDGHLEREIQELKHQNTLRI